MRRWKTGTLGAAALALLAACDDPKPAAPRAAGPSAPASAIDDRSAAALQVTEERLRTRLRTEAPLSLRAMQTHRQALADTLAVCGQVNPSGRGDDPFIPFVAVIGFEGANVARTDFHLAATSPEATRVYHEMVDRCFDGGGPANARTVARPLPPSPNVSPSLAPGEPAPAIPTNELRSPAPPALSVAPSQASGTAVMRSPANIRMHPSGGGDVVRVAPRGSQLQIFGSAPGGWYQVGQNEPWGWVHGSMLER